MGGGDRGSECGEEMVKGPHIHVIEVLACVWFMILITSLVYFCRTLAG